MARKQKRWHYIYKTTNVINGKFYIGMHSTDDLKDEYIGSGRYLWNSIRKYGRKNFKIEFLEFYDDREKLREREKNLVNEDLLKDPKCMNLMRGGEGGFVSVENQFKRSQAGGLAAAKVISKERKREIGTKGGNTAFKKKVGLFGPNNKRFSGKIHTTKTRILIGQKNSAAQSGNKNSQFGTCWIFKDTVNKKIKKEELNNWLNLGWFKGRYYGR